MSGFFITTVEPTSYELRLLNVAVSRARHKLIMVCDPSYIRSIPGNTITDKTRKIFDKLSRYGW